MAIEAGAVLDLATRIRGRLQKEARNQEMAEELAKSNPKLAQLVVDVDWILTDWAHKTVRKGARS
jgi:hypothetical protein